MKRNILAVLGSVVLVALIAQPIFAQKPFLEELKKIYPGLDNKFANCKICHAVEEGKKPGKKNLNGYGKELQAAPEAKAAMSGEHKKYTAEELKGVADAIKAIGSKDSNGNGKSNDDDIKAGVNPGVK